MNCNNFKDNLPEFISGDMSSTDRAAMEHHAAQCEQCRREMEQVSATIEALTPQRIVTPSEGFEARILAAATAAQNAQTTTATKASKPRRTLFVRLTTGFVSAAAVIAVVLTVGLNTPVRAARSHFTTAIAALERVETMLMEFRVRTLPDENFAFTDPHLDFVEHRLQVVYTPQLVWRMEKSGHVAVSNGEELRQWWPDWKHGSITSNNIGVLAELQALIDPRMLMQIELEMAREIRNARYEITNDGERTHLKVETPPQGDFSQSDYTLYSSILASHTRREYTFSADGHLLAARVTFLDPEGEVALLEVDRILYDSPIDTAALTALPDSVEWTDLRISPESVTLAGISADEAARRILNAMQNWDAPVAEAMHFLGEQRTALLREKYEGMQVLTLNKAVRSGDYAGVFIPCKVMLRDGTTEELMIALRNDTPSGGWIVDGGL